MTFQIVNTIILLFDFIYGLRRIAIDIKNIWQHSYQFKIIKSAKFHTELLDTMGYLSLK